MTVSSPSGSLEQIIKAFDPRVPLENAWTPPSAWYQSAPIAELDRKQVFRSSWQPVARIEQLNEPGAYVSGCFAAEPWLLVRGEDDTLRAFFNVCKHKGREVVTGKGTSTQLTCGYHAWRYDLDGRLRSAPRMAGIKDFAREDMSLTPMAVECWGPWVFINQDIEAPALTTRFPEVTQLLAHSGWDELVYAGSQSWTLECNWKVYVDNYLDGGYHVPFMHPSLSAQIDMDSYRTEIHERSSVQSSAPARISMPDDPLSGARRIGDRAIYAWLYPNFMLNRYGPCLDSNHIVPLSPTRCRVDYDFYFDATGFADDEARRSFIDSSIEQSAVTQREDIAICESVQIGLASSSYDRGRYAPQVEQGEHHFHCLLSTDYAQALGSEQ